MRTSSAGLARPLARPLALFAAAAGGLAGDAACSVSELLGMLKKAEEEATKRFAVFQVGDKDAYNYDERGSATLSHALSQSEPLGPRKTLYLRLTAGDHVCAQTYNVVRRVAQRLGYRSSFATAAPAEGDPRITLPGAEIPLRVLEHTDDAQLRASLTSLMERNALASDPGSRNSESGDLQLDKARRAHIIRTFQLYLGEAQQQLRMLRQGIDLRDPRLVNILDLYAKSWTNLASTW